MGDRRCYTPSAPLGLCWCISSLVHWWLTYGVWTESIVDFGKLTYNGPTSYLMYDHKGWETQPRRRIQNRFKAYQPWFNLSNENLD